jgi:hypothetical protein
MLVVSALELVPETYVDIGAIGALLSTGLDRVGPTKQHGLPRSPSTTNRSDPRPPVAARCRRVRRQT